MELTVNNEFGEGEKLKQVYPRKVYENLGFFIARDVSQKYQLQEIRQKYTFWEDKIQTVHLPVQEAWKYLSSAIILKTGLPSTGTNSIKKRNMVS